MRRIFLHQVSCIQFNITVIVLQDNCIYPPHITVKYFQKGGGTVNIHDKLRALIKARGWSEYRLAKEAGLSESTIANVFRRNTNPSIPTLEAICAGMGITLSQFFAENEMIELSPELKELFDCWASLTIEQKQAVLQMLRVFQNCAK